MKITIDTKEDSHEDIKKVLQILTHVIKDENLSFSSFNHHETGLKENLKEEPVNQSNMMAMFADASEFGNQEKKVIPDTPPDFTSFLNLTTNPEKKENQEEEPKLRFF